MTNNLSPAVIKAIRSLHSSKGREEKKLFIAEGVRTVTTMLEAGFMLRELYITAENQNHLGKKYYPTIISEATMARISTSKTPSGVLAIFPIPAEPAHTELSAGLVLAQVSDPGNMGTLIRSTAAFGFTTVVVVEGCDPYSPKVVQAATGSLAHVKLFQWSWDKLMLHKGDKALCALDAHGEDYGQQLQAEPLIVVGNEAHGIPKPWLAQCDIKLTLPTASVVESLNAAIAGSIALFLFSKVRKP